MEERTCASSPRFMTPDFFAIIHLGMCEGLVVVVHNNIQLKCGKSMVYSSG
jgi:hypothetical protein